MRKTRKTSSGKERQISKKECISKGIKGKDEKMRLQESVIRGWRVESERERERVRVGEERRGGEPVAAVEAKVSQMDG